MEKIFVIKDMEFITPANDLTKKFVGVIPSGAKLEIINHLGFTVIIGLVSQLISMNRICYAIILKDGKSLMYKPSFITQLEFETDENGNTKGKIFINTFDGKQNIYDIEI